MPETNDELPRILCVDDEANVLAGLERSLFSRYDVVTATSGAEGLRRVAEDGPFAVVMADMRMPRMNGAEFLSRVREMAPDTTRLLLTGQADIDSAVAAVNEAGVFRFLLKPCPYHPMSRALEEAVNQHRLAVAERELVEHTLRDTVGMLTEVLALASPVAFDRARRLGVYARHVVSTLGWEDPWIYEVAALLSQIGCITVPPEVLRRVSAGRELTAAEQAMIDAHPGIAEQLLAAIPHLDDVASIVACQLDPGHVVDETVVGRGAALLDLLLRFDSIVSTGAGRDEAVRALRTGARGAIAGEVLAALGSMPEDGSISARNVAVGGPTRRLALTGDVLASDRTTIAAAGTEVTPMVLRRLQNFASTAGVIGSVRVLVPGSDPA